MRSFLLVYYGGTGSSWLLHSLGSVPRVLVPASEPLEAWAWDADDDQKLAWLAAALAPPQPDDVPGIERWVDALCRAPQVEGLAKRNFDTVGFKLSLEAIADHDRLLEVLGASNTRLVFLERANRIKHALSLYRSHEQQKDQFHDEGQQEPTRVKLRRFHRWVEVSVAAHRTSVAFRSRCLPVLGETRIHTVFYEELLDDAGKAAVIDRLAGFIGLDPAKVRPSSYRKATPDDLATAIVNYRAVERRYAGGPLAGFFTD